MNKFWFKPKKYGWGFVPISWEGWLMTLLLILTIFLSAYSNKIYVEPVLLEEGYRFLLDILIIVSIFSIFSIPKTKGKVKWRWGNEK